MRLNGEADRISVLISRDHRWSLNGAADQIYLFSAVPSVWSFVPCVRQACRRLIDPVSKQISLLELYRLRVNDNSTVVAEQSSRQILCSDFERDHRWLPDTSSLLELYLARGNERDCPASEGSPARRWSRGVVAYLARRPSCDGCGRSPARRPGVLDARKGDG